MNSYLTYQVTCYTPPHAPGPVSVEFSSDDLNYTTDGCTFTYLDRFAPSEKIPVSSVATVLNPCVLETCKPQQAVWYNNNDDRGSF
jgi:hypothetical protein